MVRLGALCAILDKLDEFLPRNAVVLADLERLDDACVDQSIGFVAPDRQSIGNVLHAEDEGHGIKILVNHGESSFLLQ